MHARMSKVKPGHICGSPTDKISTASDDFPYAVGAVLLFYCTAIVVWLVEHIKLGSTQINSALGKHVPFGCTFGKWWRCMHFSLISTVCPICILHHRQGRRHNNKFNYPSLSYRPKIYSASTGSLFIVMMVTALFWSLSSRHIQLMIAFYTATSCFCYFFRLAPVFLLYLKNKNTWQIFLDF